MKNKKIVFYVLLSLITLIPICLIFSKSIWFDESYTLALIKHDYTDIVRILKLDMHPPLYFLSLKLFCDIFGYSLVVTKIFSLLGYMSTILVCGLILKKHFNAKTSLIFSLVFLAIPKLLYFSVQQRSYSWAIFFVTLCLLETIVFFFKDDKLKRIIVMSFAALLAAYNHFFALLVIGIIYLMINIYVMIFKRKYLLHMIISDLFMLVGYAFWILPLFTQARDAIGGFWVTGIDISTVFIFIGSIIIVTLLMLKKDNRRLDIIFISIVAISFQAIALLGSIIIRPFYITRYVIVISGIGALLIALGIDSIHKIIKTSVVGIFSVIGIISLVSSISFEYNDSMLKFLERSENLIRKEDIFVYFDNSFGIMSYYYPENKHLCTYNKAWFDAFESVDRIKSNEVIDYINDESKTYVVKMDYTKIPSDIYTRFEINKIDEFRCDYNNFEMFELILK
ncbi:MAG: glycosyltransferase family 39 protein [Erysipelotrichales bacterium]|nr:glycosyltransferase family 39 protein [Erysipelotrichales bacterium]